MKNSEILHILLLDAFEYEDEPTKVKAYLKNYVNNALDNSEWIDGFETAVKSGVLDHYEYKELINAIKTGFPELQFDKDVLFSAIDEALPRYFELAGSSWLAGDNFVILTDELSIGKYQDGRFVWITPRISLDGIELKEITGTAVKGKYWNGDPSYENYSPNCDFEIDLKNGVIIKGEIID